MRSSPQFVHRGGPTDSVASMSDTRTMRSVAALEYGPPEVLQVITEQAPAVGVAEVLVAVDYATVNPADLSFRSGEIPQISGGAPFIGGLECSGTVLSAPDGSGLNPGQRVAATTSFIPSGRGCHSEVVRFDARSVTPIPENLAADLAATIPMSGLTALLAVDRADVSPGQTLVVTGAGGAVGGFAVEIAARRGARVIGLCAARHVERVLSLGAESAVPRSPHAVSETIDIAGGPVDAVIDAAVMGNQLRGLVRDRGTLCTLRGSEDLDLENFTIERISVRDYQSDPDKLRSVIDDAAEGRLTPRVQAVFSLDEAPQAHRSVEARGLDGRVLLDFSSNGS